MTYSTVKPLALSLLTSLMLIGCQPASDTATNADTNKEVATDTQPTIAQPSIQDTSSASSTPSTVTDSNPTSQTTTSAVNEVVTQPITILALGDSLTEGLGVPEEKAYPAQLQRALNDAGYINAKVINSGLSGETSSGLVNRLDWVLKTHPDVTILTIGANDAMRGIDVALVEENIRTAIERLQSEGSIVVLGGMQIYDNLGDDYVRAFSDIYPKLAQEYDIAFIPFFLEGVGGVAELNQADAIHPTEAGYTRIVNQNILPVLKPTLETFTK